MEAMMREVKGAGKASDSGLPGAGGAEPTLEELMALLQMYESNPESAPPELSELMQAVREQKGQATAADKLAQGHDIVPEPGFVIKTVDEKGQKVFINICGSSKIAAPGVNWENGQVPEAVQKALDQGENLDEAGQQALRFPISMGEPRADMDRKGEACKVFDCVLNDEVCKTATKGHRQLKNFIIELAMGWIQHKHKNSLDPKFKLPRMKYKGEQVCSMRIRVDKKALVQEVIDDKLEEPDFPLVTKPIPATAARPPPEIKRKLREHAAASQGHENSTAAPRQSQPSVYSSQELGHEVRFVGKPAQAVEIDVRPPQGSPAMDGSQVSVEVLADVVYVEAKGYPRLQVKLPFFVGAAGADAALSEGGQLLQLTLPYRPFTEVLEQMRCEAPHQFGDLGLSNSFLDLD